MKYVVFILYVKFLGFLGQQINGRLMSWLKSFGPFFFFSKENNFIKMHFYFDATF